MELLKYILVIVAYEISSFATGAVGSIVLSASGVLDPNEGLAAYGTKIMLMRYVTTLIAIVAVAWIATRYDAMREK